MADLRTAAQQALEDLTGVLCDPDGRCCIDGSSEDRAIVDRALSKIRAALAEQEQGRKKRKPKNSTTPLGIVCFEAYARSEVGSNRWDIAAEAVRAALAEPEQEPVRLECREHGQAEWVDCSREAFGINPRRYVYRALYTATPARQPLTDEEIVDAVRNADLDWHAGWSLDDDALNRYVTLIRAVERAHGIGGNDE